MIADMFCFVKTTLIVSGTTLVVVLFQQLPRIWILPGWSILFGIYLRDFSICSSLGPLKNKIFFAFIHRYTLTYIFLNLKKLELYKIYN